MTKQFYIKLSSLILFFSLLSGSLLAQAVISDNFSSGDYSGGTGWKSDWGEGNDWGAAANGRIRINGGRLRFEEISIYDQEIKRTLDLNAVSALSASLKFNWETVNLTQFIGDGEELNIQISSNVDGPFTTIGSFKGTQNDVFIQDISSYISANTTIRFINTSDLLFGDWESGEVVYIDNIEISYTSGIPEQSFWYKADAGVGGNVSSWADQSGNGNNANNSGSVTSVDSDINFNPSLSFNSVNRQFPVAENSTVQTFVIVNKTPSSAIVGNDLSGLIGVNGDKGVRLANQNVNPLGPDVTPYHSWKGDDNSDDWINSGVGRINGVVDADVVHDGKWHIANMQRSAPLTGNYYLGGYYNGRSYNGNIAEVIAFKGTVSNPERIESYLAIKYGITLGDVINPVDYQDASGTTIWSGSTTYQHNVAGIGREDAYGLHQKVSSSINTDVTESSNITIATSNDFTSSNQSLRSNLSDGQYLIWGDNDEVVTNWKSFGGYKVVERQWKLENTGNVGEVYFQINLNSYASPSGGYSLIVDNDEDPSNGIDGMYSLTNTTGDLYTTSFDPSNGVSYLFIGYQDLSLTVADCLGAKTICDAVYDEPSPEIMGQGNVTNELPSGDCIPGEKNGIWYAFSPQTDMDGTLKFTITPNDNNDDYDWVIFDVTNANCEDLAGIDITTSDVFVSGNTYGANGYNGPTGADGTTNGNCNGPGTGNGPKWNDDISVKSGHNYVLYVSNWSESNNGYTISFNEGGTATIYDDVLPDLDGVVQACYGGNELNIKFTEIIPCGTLEEDNVIVTIGGKLYNVTTITSSNCDLGASGSVDYIFNLDRPIADTGAATIKILAAGIMDMCGNVNDEESILPFSVSEITASLSTNNNPLCVGDNITLTASASGGSGTYTYEFLLNGTFLVSGAQDFIELASDEFVNGDVVKVNVTDENACSASSAEMTLVVNPLPEVPITDNANQSFCGSASVEDLEATSTGNDIDWYDAAVGGNLLNATTTLSDGATYYAEAKNASAGCTSLGRLAVNVSIDPVSVGGTVSGTATVCSGTNFTELTLSGHTGDVVKWQSSTDNFTSDVNDIINTGVNYTVTNITVTTSYRAVVQSGVCTTVESGFATVAVDDSEAPVADAASLPVITEQCEVTSLTAPTATDNCDGSITGTHTQTFPITASTTVVWTYTDGSGNSSTQNQSIVIDDTIDPTISCPGDITQTADAGSCDAVVTYATPVGSDNCAGATTVQTAGLASGAIFPIGTTTNTFEVTDAAGNKATCSFDVTVTKENNISVVDVTGTTNPETNVGFTDGTHCPDLNGLHSVIEPSGNTYSPGTSQVQFRVNRLCDTGAWSFNYSIGGTGVTVHKVLISGVGTTTNASGVVNADPGTDYILFTIDINNVVGTILPIDFTISNGGTDSAIKDAITIQHNLKIIPQIVGFE